MYGGSVSPINDPQLPINDPQLPTNDPQLPTNDPQPLPNDSSSNKYTTLEAASPQLAGITSCYVERKEDAYGEEEGEKRGVGRKRLKRNGVNARPAANALHHERLL